MATTKLRFRGGWILLATGTLQPGAVGPFERVYGLDPTGAPVQLDTDSTVTSSVAQIIQQWESSSGNVFLPLAYNELVLEEARQARELDPITITSALVPLPKIYGATGAAGDATSLQGVPIAVTAPNEGQALVYLSGQWRPGGWNKGPKIVVGNSTAGDTLAVCDYLDTGNGAQLQAALTDAGALASDADVWVRPGLYTLGTTITIPQLVTMRCSGFGTVFAVTATQRKAFILQGSGSMEDVSITVPVPAGGAAGTEVVELQTGSFAKRCRIVMAAQNAGQAANESLRYGFRTPATAGVNMVYCIVQGVSFRELGVAQDFVNFYIESSVAAQHSALSHIRSQSGDYCYDLRGCVEMSNWYANAPGVAALRLTSLTGTNRVSPRVSTGQARVLHTAGLTKYGAILDTGTDAAGMLGCGLQNASFFTTSTEVNSTGIALLGIGEGASVDNCLIDSFPKSMTVSATQAYARGANLSIKNSVAPTDASGTCIFPNPQVFP